MGQDTARSPPGPASRPDVSLTVCRRRLRASRADSRSVGRVGSSWIERPSTPASAVTLARWCPQTAYGGTPSVRALRDYGGVRTGPAASRDIRHPHVPCPSIASQPERYGHLWSGRPHGVRRPGPGRRKPPASPTDLRVSAANDDRVSEIRNDVCPEPTPSSGRRKVTGAVGRLSDMVYRRGKVGRGGHRLSRPIKRASLR